ncbi:MAG: hypothetical protein GOV02_02610 [Candidatus Aenigmarchaeota archaeon]|nr:hypothetical protein [Candidatus Aenigmarchaeota archaeon]
MTVYVFDTRTQEFNSLEWVGPIDEEILANLGYKSVKEGDGDLYLMKGKPADKEERKKALFEYAAILNNLGSC